MNPNMKPKEPSFLEKPILDTMEDFYRFQAYCQRPDMPVERKVCSVTPEIFEILTLGQSAPFLWDKGVQVFNSETRGKAEELLLRKTDMVVPR